jgi:hypothetical protein
MRLGLDAYSFPARVIPFVAVSVPPLVLFGCGVITGARVGIGAGLIIAVLAAIAGQMGRDRGRALQEGLWASWGGSPTLQRLRHCGHSSAGRVERLHGRIEAILDETLPSATEENADPTTADDRYDEISARIRALTQDRERFPLLFAENVNYGQRRNLLGWRPVGIAVAAVTLAASGLALWLVHSDLSERLVRFGPGVSASVAMLGLWVLVVRRDWVRVAAEAYADQFVAAIDRIHHERSQSKPPA